jgi:hypothetical protein
MPPRAASTRPSSTTSSHNQSRASSSATEGKKTGKSPSTSSQRQRSLCALRLYHRSRLKHTRLSLHLRRDQGLLQPLPPILPTRCILFMTSSKVPTGPLATAAATVRPTSPPVPFPRSLTEPFVKSVSPDPPNLWIKSTSTLKAPAISSTQLTIEPRPMQRAPQPLHHHAIQNSISPGPQALPHGSKVPHRIRGLRPGLGRFPTRFPLSHCLRRVCFLPRNPLAPLNSFWRHP